MLAGQRKKTGLTTAEKDRVLDIYIMIFLFGGTRRRRKPESEEEGSDSGSRYKARAFEKLGREEIRVLGIYEQGGANHGGVIFKHSLIVFFLLCLSQYGGGDARNSRSVNA